MRNTMNHAIAHRSAARGGLALIHGGTRSVFSIARRLLPLTILVGALATAACQQQDQPAVTHGEDFIPQGEMRSTQRFALVQEANGARADATLYACHFDGATLNSLGEQ